MSISLGNGVSSNYIHVNLTALKATSIKWFVSWTYMANPLFSKFKVICDLILYFGTVWNFYIIALNKTVLQVAYTQALYAFI